MTHLSLKKMDTPLCQLGEGLCWDLKRNCMWWLDIELQKIYAIDHDTGVVSQWSHDKTIGMITMMDNDNVLAFADGELFEFYPDSGIFEQLSENFMGDAKDVLVNDGKVDRHGGLVLGTKHTTCDLPTASLYYVDSDVKQGRVLRNEITVCNGPAFNPNGDKMYFADTPTQIINVYDYDAKTGTISNPEDFIACPHGHYPDGMTVDADGYLWNAVWNGHCVKRYAPDGTLDLTLEVPTSLNITNVCFGGQDLKTLYITSAYSGMDAKGREQYPDSGALFTVDVSQLATGIADKAYSF